VGVPFLEVMADNAGEGTSFGTLQRPFLWREVRRDGLPYGLVASASWKVLR